VCRALTAKLSRKRPSPLEGGRINTWAAAITHTIGRVNFLFDKSQTPTYAPMISPGNSVLRRAP
jgi:hypothetical protein